MKGGKRMLYNLKSDYAGNLYEELEEVQKLIPSEDAVETAATITERCSAVLTIFCC